MAIEGVWSVDYRGDHGRGNAVLTMRNGFVVGLGTDAGQAQGTYLEQADGIKVSLQWVALISGAAPVQTGLPMRAGSGFSIDALLPPNFGAGQTITFSTALGPVQAEFRQIATIP